MQEYKEIAVVPSNKVVITPNEVALVQMAANDVDRKTIAQQLEISVRTVESKFDRIKMKVSVKSMTGLVALFFRNKLID